MPSIIPSEILYIIIGYCDGYERCQLELVNKLFYNIAHNFLGNSDREVRLINPYKKFVIFNLAKKGYKEILNICLKYNSNFKDAISGACRGGFLDLAKYYYEIMILTKQAEGFEWSVQLYNACHGSSLKLIKWMFDQTVFTEEELTMALYYSCYSTYEIYQYIFKKQQRIIFRNRSINRNTNFLQKIIYKEIIFYAYLGGNEKIINEAINLNESWFEGFKGACHGGHLNFVNFILENHYEKIKDFNDAMKYACKGGHLHIVKVLHNFTYLCRSSIKKAIKSGNVDLIKYVIPYINDCSYILLKNLCSMNSDSIISSDTKKLELFILFLEKLEVDYNDLKKLLFVQIDHKIMIHLVELLEPDQKDMELMLNVYFLNDDIFGVIELMKIFDKRFPEKKRQIICKTFIFDVKNENFKRD